MGPLRSIYLDYWAFASIWDRVGFVWICFGILCLVVFGLLLLMEEIAQGRRLGELIFRSVIFVFFLGGFVVVFGPLAIIIIVCRRLMGKDNA